MSQDIATFLADWLASNQSTLYSVLAIIAVALVITMFGERFIKRAVTKAVKADKYSTKAEERRREETLSLLIGRALRVLVWPLAIMSILSQFGVQIGPLIAGAGVAGLAIGFGAQSLVKDMFAGLFIVIENQYRVGDVVGLDGTVGTVEDISLRKTGLRDMDGVLHHVPNGAVTVVSNFSSGFSGINLNVGVAYDTDIEKATKIINEVGLDLAGDDDWKKKIIEPPSFLRVDNFSPSSVDIKITGKVQPLAQWEVTGELRKRLKVAFDKNGIEIPLPQTVIHQSPAPKKRR